MQVSNKRAAQTENKKNDELITITSAAALSELTMDDKTEPNYIVVFLRWFCTRNPIQYLVLPEGLNIRCKKCSTKLSEVILSKRVLEFGNKLAFPFHTAAAYVLLVIAIYTESREAQKEEVLKCNRIQ